MTLKLKNAAYLISYAWSKCKLLFFTTGLKYVFAAILPLINIAGLGLVVNALIENKQIHNIILVYICINLFVSIVKTIITLFDNIVMRKASDITQLEYIKDCVFINYHYVQDGSILDLKKKSMGANPVWFLDRVGTLLLYIIQFIGVASIYAYLSPLFILILALTSFVSITLNFKKQKYDFEFQNAQVTENRKLEYLFKLMTEYKYAKEIRINQANRYITTKYKDIINKQILRLRMLFRNLISIDMVINIITILQALVMYIYFSYQVYSYRIGISEYTVLLGATTLTTSIFIGFFDIIGKINKTLNYTELFREYRDKVYENSKIMLDEHISSPEIKWTEIEISFLHVTFKYPGSEKLILDDVSFTVKQGEKIGIVGLNGSGKTTLIKLLCRIYDPTSGVITINGIDIRKLQYSEYISKIGIVLQDYCLFAYSIKENIKFNKEFDEVRVNDAINKCGLSGKILSLGKGVDTVLYKELNDEGVEFSSGEGQKLALCRAIYKDASMYILDEPSSTHDPIAEHELFSNLASISNGKTTFFISHRLSSMKYCDRILVLADSHIIESGSHEELIGLKGYYYELFNSQAKLYNRGKI